MKSKIEALENEIAHLNETQTTKVRATIARQKKQISTKQNTLDKLVGTKRKREEKKQKSPKKITREGILEKIIEIAPLLFLPPKNIIKNWNGVLTTDGITCSWHCTKPAVHPKNTKKRKKGHETKKEDIIPPNIISVDPGHVNLISASRKHANPIQLFADSNISKRRKSKLLKYRKLGLSEFNLSNREWRNNCGQIKTQYRRQRLSKLLNEQPAIDLLSNASSRTSKKDTYLKHIEARLATAESFIQSMSLKCTRRWKFEVYQKEQRTAKKTATDLLGDLPPSETLVLWGSGGFSPTSKGHASAPNLKLRKLLNRHLIHPIVLACEYGSSKTSCCCHEALEPVRFRKQNTRTSVLKCSRCRVLLSRDFNAANVIRDMFLDMQKSDDINGLPEWVQCKKKTKTLLITL